MITIKKLMINLKKHYMMITDSELIAVAPFNENNDSQVVAVENMTKRTKKKRPYGMTSKHLMMKYLP